MEEIKNHEMFQESPWFDQYNDHGEKPTSSSSSTTTTSSSIGEESTVSNGSSSISSSDITDDASSSSASSSFSANSANGSALYDLTEIMAQLPIKRGLSQFYQGKSESFTSLSRVTSIEDLAKKAGPYRRNLKASKSCGNGLNSCYKPYTSGPKAVITKKAAKGSFFSSFPSKRGSFLSCNKPPMSPVHNNLEY